MCAALLNEDFKAAKAAIRENWRYQGTNWASLHKHGTLEFRHFPGEYRPDIILRWTNLILRMGEFAKGHTVAEVYDLILQGEDQFGRAVFGYEWPGLVKNYHNHEHDWLEVLDIAGIFMATLNVSTMKESFHDVLARNYLIGGE